MFVIGDWKVWGYANDMYFNNLPGILHIHVQFILIDEKKEKFKSRFKSRGNVQWCASCIHMTFMLEGLLLQWDLFLLCQGRRRLFVLAFDASFFGAPHKQLWGLER